MDQLFEVSPSEWLDCIPDYQRKYIDGFIKQGVSYDAAAEKWLTADVSSTAPFGGKKGKPILLNSLIAEIEKFLCDDQAYKQEKQQLKKDGKLSHKYFLQVITAAIAAKMGVSGVFIAPPIALVLASFGKITLNAWCATRKRGKG